MLDRETRDLGPQTHIMYSGDLRHPPSDLTEDSGTAMVVKVIPVIKKIGKLEIKLFIKQRKY